MVSEHMNDQDASPVKARWCLVGNIVEQRRFGEGGLIVKPGTKHFSPGTKVYCLPPQWGDGYEQIVVIGRHRGASRLCTMIVSFHHVTNWRAKLVYSPQVHRLMDEWAEEPGHHWVWNEQDLVEKWIPSFLAREREWNLKHPLPANDSNLPS